MTVSHRVLVVDDNEDATTALCMLLQAMGHEAAEAHDGPEALEVALAFQPDLVLLDIGLPTMDGYEVARRLQADIGEKCTLVALTGWSLEEHREKTAEAGFVHHLVKPVDAETLRKLLAGEDL
jgi:CheY-like chemotaxis protein